MTFPRKLLATLLLTGCSFGPPPDRGDADAFLRMYAEVDQRLLTTALEARWKASTDVTEAHTGERIGAEAALAAFRGSPVIIERSQSYLDSVADLTDLEFRQLDKILLLAAECPGAIPDIVSRRVKAEANAAATLEGFVYCAERQGEQCVKPVTPAEIDEVLLKSNDLEERRRFWELSKQSGPVLKHSLAELRDLRNRLARELGYSSYFHLQVADYGLSVDELMELMDRTVEQVRPLYEQLHLYARRTLAERYGQPVPEKIPAHWLGNRWGQEWPGLVKGLDLDPFLAGKSPEWIVRQAERFYESIGMGELPESFWLKSDYLPVPGGEPRKKDPQTSAWHMDRDRDVRVLMNVAPSFYWFESSHHELGHAYYFLAYSNDDVPYLLRDSLNRSFHEAFANLGSLAARQEGYLRKIGLLPEDLVLDRTESLLAEALERTVVFLPWAAGVMTHFEHDLYEEDLPEEEFNRRWWELVERYQGIVPPEPRDESFCDACTKTHLISAPARYYDYAIGHLLTYQLHDHISYAVLGQNPHEALYFGEEDVGDWLKKILRLGATRNWQTVLKESTGEDLSSRAMLEYFQPLLDYLKKVNSEPDPQ